MQFSLQPVQLVFIGQWMLLHFVQHGVWNVQGTAGRMQDQTMVLMLKDNATVSD